MTPEQYNEARKILAKDCGLARRYINARGSTCAIGALALAAGVTPGALMDAGGSSIASLPKVSRAIERRFGLTAAMQRDLQFTNDWHPTRNRRRRGVLAELDYINSHPEYYR